jgi:hypothetical protein
MMSGGPNIYPLAEGEFAAYVTSYVPIVAERAMYWYGPPGPWADGTTTFGSTSLGTRWGFAEGRVGGPQAFHTYLRLFNMTYQQAADVTVTFLKTDGTTVVQTWSVPGVANQVPPPALNFLTIDVNTIAGLDGESFGILIESTKPIATERSMYWDADGVFWAAGLATAGTRLPSNATSLP